MAKQEVTSADDVRRIVSKYRPPRLTPEERAQRDTDIAQARADGMTVAQTAEKFGIDKGNVSRAVQRHEARRAAPETDRKSVV